jgi:hypothetical protein
MRLARCNIYPAALSSAERRFPPSRPGFDRATSRLARKRYLPCQTHLLAIILPRHV